MPMIVYTEEEVIDKCNEAEAMGANRAAAHRSEYMSENTQLRRSLNDARDALRRIINSPTINNLCGWYPEITVAKELLDGPLKETVTKGPPRPSALPDHTPVG